MQSRSLGPLLLTWQLNRSRGDALVTASLAGTELLRQRLTLAASRLPVDVALGTSSATGTITLQLAAPPQQSLLEVDLVTQNGKDVGALKGALASWLATGEPVVTEFEQAIMPDLSVRTTVRGRYANIVQIDFCSGALTLWSANLIQLSPIQVLPFDIAAGSVQIDKGATVTLSIPTTMQPGALFLQATVSSRNTARHAVATDVARWTLPP